jgi:hypothetical protein
MAAQVTLLNFRQHLLDIGRRKFILRGGPKGFELLTYVSKGFFALSGVKSLADPFGDAHPSGAGYPLDFAIVRVLKKDLQALSHMVSLNDSSQ